MTSPPNQGNYRNNVSFIKSWSPAIVEKRGKSQAGLGSAFPSPSNSSLPIYPGKFSL